MSGWTYIDGKRYDILSSEEEIDNYLETIKFNLQNKENIISKLRTKVAELEDEQSKDKTIKKLQVTLKEARENIYRGFPITKEESNKISEWKSNHDKTVHNNDKGYHGAIGGGYAYEFYPTSIGTIGECICTTCRNRVIKNLKEGESWRAALENCGGVFTFQEL